MPVTSVTADRVLVLMPTVRDSERTGLLLEEAHLPAVICAEITDLCRELRSGAGAVLLTDEAISRDAFGQLAETLRDQPAWSAVPVVVLAREGWTRNGGAAPSELLRNLIIVERPVRTRTLLSVLSSALRGRRHQYAVRDAMLMCDQKAAEALAQDERLRFALSAGGLGSWELDLVSNELHCSDICKANFGRGASAPFSYSDLRDAIHPDDRARVDAAIDQSISTGADYDIEYRVIWPSGETRWMLLRGRATYDDESGRPRRMAGVSLDITERKQMHEALVRSQAELARQADELRRADRRKDEFLATLAHELRNPLAPIRTGMDLLERGADGESRERTLGIMHRQLSHMVRLIDDLLDVSRITRGKLELKRARVSLAEIIDAAVDASRPLIERKQHQLRVSLDPEPLCFDADLTRMAQVVSNLLNNASNYTPSGGSIELSARGAGAHAVIQVRDNGIGIPHGRLEEVFEMFSQVNRATERSQGGLGIGLALVRSLVEMHGGTVSAASGGLGLGSTFTVTLPLATRNVRAERSDVALTPASQRGRKRILVVDDNQDAADLLALALEQSGYHTTTAYDGPSALNAAGVATPDVVILDIGLPGMTGYDVARALRQDRRFEALSLIALTGWGSHDDKQKAIAAGFDLHLTKPVDATHLQAALAELDDGSRRRAPESPASSSVQS